MKWIGDYDIETVNIDNVSDKRLVEMICILKRIASDKITSYYMGTEIPDDLVEEFLDKQRVISDKTEEQLLCKANAGYSYLICEAKERGLIL